MAIAIAVGLGVSALASVPVMVFGGLPNPNYPQPGIGIPSYPQPGVPSGCLMFCDPLPSLPNPGFVPSLPDCAVPPYDGGAGWSMPLDQGPNDSPFGVTGY